LPSVHGRGRRGAVRQPDTSRLFEHLYRRHLFVDRRRAGERNVYHFHGLFREFLLAEGRARLSDDERSEALARRGGIAGRARRRRRGRVDLPRRRRVARARRARARRVDAPDRRGDATRRCATGSCRCRRACATRIPSLVYALAVTHVYGDPALAKSLLAQGARRVRSARRHRAARCSPPRVDRLSLPRVGRLRAARPLDRGARARARGKGALRSATEELRVRASLLLAVLFRQPAHPELATHARAVATLLASEAIAAAPVNVRLSAASCCSTTTTGRPRASRPTR
jgi:hypothetical protein